MIKSKAVVLKTPLSSRDVLALAAAVKACKILAFPTDTVYGLGSTGLVKAAARRIYRIKGRPASKPLPLLVDSIQAARRWVEWTPAAAALAAKFWPGALTLVLKATEQGKLLAGPESSTLAIRVPNHPELLKVIEASGLPWATTSANISDEPSLTDGAEVARRFGESVDFIIDGGKTAGVESTLVDAASEPVRILREGALSARSVFDALSQSV